jgi:uncharacterized protein (DUF1778 family)
VKTTAKEARTERLVARISPRDKEIIERAAEMEGRSLASFTTEHLLAKAREVIEERTVIRLNEEESRRFVEILNAPPRKPAGEMLDALKWYRETVISDVNQPAK